MRELLNGYRWLESINIIDRDQISSFLTSSWISLRMHRYIMKSCLYANVKQNFPWVPDFLSGARCAVFLLSVVLAAEIPCSVMKEDVAARITVTCSISAGSFASAFLLSFCPPPLGSESSTPWERMDFEPQQSLCGQRDFGGVRESKH